MIQIQLIDTTNHDIKGKIKSLIKGIDAKLAKLAKIELNNLRFFLDKSDSCKSCEDFNDLVYYRHLLSRKIAGDCCLEGVHIEVIMTRIKKLIK